MEKTIGTRAASMTPIAWSNIPEDLQELSRLESLDKHKDKYRT